MITGKELVEKMYSDNYSEYEDTRLYSTGDDYLDDLLEKAFCEGYEYAQREFAKKEEKKKKDTTKSSKNKKQGSSEKKTNQRKTQKISKEEKIDRK